MKPIKSDSEDEDVLGDFFPPESTLETYTYKFSDDIVINIKGQELQNVNTQKATGLLPWPASLILSKYIFKFNNIFNVQELEYVEFWFRNIQIQLHLQMGMKNHWNY
eukprot:gene7591-9335_t